MNCSRCGNALAEGSAACPQCGAPVFGGQAQAPGQAAAGQATAGAWMQGYAFNPARLSQVDKITGVASVLLLISLFLPWFSVSASFVSISWSGLTAHGYLWLVFLLCLGIAGFLALGAGFDQLPVQLPLDRERLLLITTAVNLLLVLLAFFISPGVIGGGVGWSFGAFLGLFAAIAACLPLALPVIRGQR